MFAAAADNLPNLAVIARPSRIAEMISISKRATWISVVSGERVEREHEKVMGF